jgi:hypothetical protein
MIPVDVNYTSMLKTFMLLIKSTETLMSFFFVRHRKGRLNWSK